MHTAKHQEYAPIIINEMCTNAGFYSHVHLLLYRIDSLASGVIKVADFGLAEDMYGTNYYRRSMSKSDERVPIKWMAPESIETNIYNETTDVVSLHALAWTV